jgi:tRNA pseudouridine55 synthase
LESGLILLNKKTGITSFDALRDIKRSLGTGKVGHTGTLDKFAQGLLIVLAGKALKLSQWFSGCDKKYKGRIHFGIETDTLDPEGNIVAQAQLPAREEVEKVLLEFTGKIMQAPPAYSAIRINGKRSSNLVREGKIPEMKKRPVTVEKIELLSWQPPFADIYVHCSSGTYIRSLTRDIAIAAGSRAFLCELTRTHIADFCLAETEEQGKENNDYKKYLQPIDKGVIGALGLSWFEVEQNEALHILNGKPLNGLLINKPLFNTLGANGSLNNRNAAVFCAEELIAVIEKEDDTWKYRCVCP